MINPPMRIRLYTLFQALILKQKYITGDHMLTFSYICIELESSTLVSGLYLNAM